MNIKYSPLITVIVPVYNSEPYLSKCIDSILIQTFTNFELLIIDDGSTDRSANICDDYAMKDNRIKIYHKRNEGVSSARNLGLDKAEGKWIAFVDSDDYIKNSYLKDLYDSIDSTSLLIIQGITYLLGNKQSERILDLGNYCVTGENLVKAFSIKKLHKCGYVYSKLYNKNIINLNKIRFDNNIHMGEDQIFMLQYIFKIDVIKFIAGSNYYYQTFTGGLSSSYASYESEYKWYSLFSNFIIEINKRKKSDDNLESLYTISSEQLMRCIFALYNPKHKKSKKERLKSLKGLKDSEISLVKKYFKTEIKSQNFARKLLIQKKFYFFDIYYCFYFNLRSLIHRIC